jgi:multidrug resistance protein
MGKLTVLMVTAFVDMMGILIVAPLLPFVTTEHLGDGPLWSVLNAIGLGGSGMVVSILIMMFSVAQLVSAPLWGRVSDRYGRRPALLIGIGASTIAYVIFAYASSLELLLLCRIVQGAGGGTVSVIQAYVADSTEPRDRAKALGWLSAATNLGVVIGPVIGSWSLELGWHAPGLVAAAISSVNLLFAWRYVTESHDAAGARASGKIVRGSREAVMRVVSHASEPPSRLIWIYAITMGAFQGMTSVLALFLAFQYGVTERTIGYFFTYVGAISVITRALVLGKMVDRFGEARLSRAGMIMLAIGLATMPLAPSVFPWFALSVALVPLGTAFTFPCVTGLLSQVVPQHERGLYMGVQQTFGGVARVAAPLYAGFAYDHFGRGVPFYTAGVLVVCAMLLGLDMEKYRAGVSATGAATQSPQ